MQTYLFWVVIAVLAVAGAGCLFECGNEVIVLVKSPDASLEAVLFERNCGATTGFSSQVSVVAAGSELENAAGNVFVADDNHGAAPTASWGGPPVAMEWRGNRDLVVQYQRNARVFKKERQVELSLGGSQRATLAIVFEAVDNPTQPPNKALQPSVSVVTPRADAHVAPTLPAAERVRSADIKQGMTGTASDR